MSARASAKAKVRLPGMGSRATPMNRIKALIRGKAEGTRWRQRTPHTNIQTWTHRMQTPKAAIGTPSIHRTVFIHSFDASFMREE